MSWDVLGRPKYVDQIDGPAEFGKRGAAGFAEYVLHSRVDWKNAVAVGLEIGRNPVGVFFGVALDAEDGNASGRFEQVADLGFVFDQRGRLR